MQKDAVFFCAVFINSKKVTCITSIFGKPQVFKSSIPLHWQQRLGIMCIDQFGNCAPDNTQLWVYYAQIWILTHIFEICVSPWCTHIFKVIKIVNGHLAHQRNQIGKVRPEHKTACLTTFLSTIQIGLHVISGSCILKLTGQKFTSFLCCYFLSMPLFSLWLKTCQTSAPQQSLTKILSLWEREVLKQLKKILAQL